MADFALECAECEGPVELEDLCFECQTITCGPCREEHKEYCPMPNCEGAGSCPTCCSNFRKAWVESVDGPQDVDRG